MGGFFEMLHPNRHANASLRAKMEQTKQNEVFRKTNMKQVHVQFLLRLTFDFY